MVYAVIRLVRTIPAVILLVRPGLIVVVSVSHVTAMGLVLIRLPGLIIRLSVLALLVRVLLIHVMVRVLVIICLLVSRIVVLASIVPVPVSCVLMCLVVLISIMSVPAPLALVLVLIVMVLVLVSFWLLGSRVAGPVNIVLAAALPVPMSRQGPILMVAVHRLIMRVRVSALRAVLTVIVMVRVLVTLGGCRLMFP